MFFSLFDRYEIFTSNWRWIEICENVVLSKIDITMTTVNKQNGIDKSRISRKLDPLLKTQHQDLKVRCLANNFREKSKILYVLIQIKLKYISNLVFLIAVIN